MSEDLLKKDIHATALRRDILERFERKVLSLVESYKELEKTDEVEDEHAEHRFELRDQAINGILRTVIEINNPYEPNYEAIFYPIIEDLFRKQQATSKVIDVFNEKIQKVNQSNMLSPVEGIACDFTKFEHYVSMMGDISMMDQLIHAFDLVPFRDKIIHSEIDKIYKNNK